MSAFAMSQDKPMIPFIDLQAQRQRLGPAVEQAMLKVIRSGAYVMALKSPSWRAGSRTSARHPSSFPVGREPRP